VREPQIRANEVEKLARYIERRELLARQAQAYDMLAVRPPQVPMTVEPDFGIDVMLETLAGVTFDVRTHRIR
jgi:hypothetical protein